MKVEADYDNLKKLPLPKIPKLNEERKVLEEALFAFLRKPADDMGTPAETIDEFRVRYEEEYDATNPVEIQIMSLDTYIDVPELCPTSTNQAAEELLAAMADFNHLSAYNLYMTQ